MKTRIASLTILCLALASIPASRSDSLQQRSGLRSRRYLGN